MEEKEARRARLEEALTRCLSDPVLARASEGLDKSAWLRRSAAVMLQLGARAVLPGDAEFPRLLVGIPDEPTHLFVRGRLPGPDDFTLAIVGTRLPTPSGSRFARESAALLSRLGATVVSGLARGIDGLAHYGALDGAGGSGRVPTVAVLASSLDVCYPPEHGRLMERVGAEGALITEFPPRSPPLKHHFIRRNRLLSGMARLVVVVEARQKSGALVTAQYAAEQGRDVAAVPGDIWSPPSLGPNGLIADGATPIVSLDALVEHCRSLGLPRPRGARALPAALTLELGSLPEDVSAVFTRLGMKGRSADLLALDLSWPAERVWPALLELELRGWARRVAEGYVRARG